MLLAAVDDEMVGRIALFSEHSNAQNQLIELREFFSEHLIEMVESRCGRNHAKITRVSQCLTHKIRLKLNTNSTSDDAQHRSWIDCIG